MLFNCQGLFNYNSFLIPYIYTCIFGSMTLQRRLPVSIFEDTRKGTLTEDVLSKQSAQFLDDQDPDTGLTLLATAVIEDFPNEVELLLARGASAEGLSLDGATPLLLAVWKCNKKEARVRIVQLLLQKLQAGSGSGSVDKTCGTADGKTALIFAVERRDAECVRLLRKAGAALKTESGLDATAMATRIGQKMNDWSLDVALDPEKDKKAHDIMTDMVMSYLEYIISWTNRFQGGTLSKSYKLDPKLDEVIHQVSAEWRQLPSLHVSLTARAVERQLRRRARGRRHVCVEYRRIYENRTGRQPQAILRGQRVLCQEPDHKDREAYRG